MWNDIEVWVESSIFNIMESSEACKAFEAWLWFSMLSMWSLVSAYEAHMKHIYWSLWGMIYLVKHDHSFTIIMCSYKGLSCLFTSKMQFEFDILFYKAFDTKLQRKGHFAFLFFAKMVLECLRYFSDWYKSFDTNVDIFHDSYAIWHVS